MKITKKDISSAEIKVNIVDPKRTSNPNFLATVSVDFGDFFVRGFRIWQTKEGNEKFAKPPSFRCSGGGWLESFVIKKKFLWQALQRRMLEEHERALMDWSVKNIDR